METVFYFTVSHRGSISLLSVYFHFTGAQTIISARLSLIKNAYSSLLKSFKDHKQQQNEANIANGHIGGIDQHIKGHQRSNDQTQGNEQQGCDLKSSAVFRASLATTIHKSGTAAV